MPEINFVKDIEELQNVDCDYHLPLGSVPGLIRNDISDFDRTVKGYGDWRTRNLWRPIFVWS